MLAQHIPLTKATGMGPLPTLLEEMAGLRPMERAFAKTQLPLAIIEHLDQEILMPQMVHLFENASREAADDLFGLRVGLAMKPTVYGKWVRYAIEAATLHGAVLRLKQTISLHQNIGNILLERQGETILLTYTHQSVVAEHGRHHADHILPPLLGIVRHFLGANWQPEWVQVFYGKDHRHNGLEQMLGTEVRYRGKGVSIALTAADLATKNPTLATAPLTSTDVLSEVLSTKAKGTLAQIEALMSLRLLEGNSDIAGVAELANSSVRSLQRLLQNEGVSYRALLDQVRFTKASTLLCETQAPITEIALMTGFSDPAHFTRSFKRWAGVPPSRLRHMQQR